MVTSLNIDTKYTMIQAQKPEMFQNMSR